MAYLHRTSRTTNKLTATAKNSSIFNYDYFQIVKKFLNKMEELQEQYHFLFSKCVSIELFGF